MSWHKQKAIELFNKFLGQCASDNGKQCLILAKNCALIAIDEIIENNPTLPTSWDGSLSDDIKEAKINWGKVRVEIINI